MPQGAAGAGGPQGALPVYGGAAASSKVFNPDIAVIGNFPISALAAFPGLGLDHATVDHLLQQISATSR